jgi:hypothetical protein
MFHYQRSEGDSIKNDSLFQLGVEMFDYYLKQHSFQFDSKKLKSKGDPFAVYLARMYGILDKDAVKKPDELREKILNYVQQQIDKVAM